MIFADLSGFTHLSEQMDPEGVRTFVDQCMHRVRWIGQPFGDAMLVLFGAPVGHEDDPERAVRAGLGLQAHLRENHLELRGLSLRIGINTGEMMYAPVGLDRNFTVMGESNNTAARLQSAARPGEILVG